MTEDITLFPQGSKEEILEVLRPQVELEILEYLAYGFFDDEKRRLIAYAIMPIDTDYYIKKAFLFNFFKDGHSFRGKAETVEKSKKCLSENTYTVKTLQECIEEGLYHQNTVTFTGEYDFDEWNITISCEFRDEDDNEEIIRELTIWDRSKFIKNSRFFNNHPNFKEVGEYYEYFRQQFPTKMKPYLGHSYHVAFVRNQKKIDINKAYEDYFKQKYFVPLSIKLKEFCPEQFKFINTFWHPLCDLLYPNHKQFCMMIFIAVDKENIKWLRCFVYQNIENQIYEWTYFPLIPYRSYKADSEEVIDSFKQISKCDSIDYLRKLECTLDDDDFWNNYVFKKENDEYLYLKEIRF